MLQRRELPTNKAAFALVVFASPGQDALDTAGAYEINLNVAAAWM